VDVIQGGASHLAITDFQSASVDSDLPDTLVITSGAIDSDHVGFACASHQFSSSTGCGTGGYEDGNREGEL
jgi:hypothetical protein